MKRLILACALLATAGVAAAAGPAAVSLSNEDAKVGYSYGFLLAKSFMQNVPALNVDAFAVGFRDAYSGKTGALTEAQMKATLSAFQDKMKAEAVAKQKKVAEENAKKGADFLAANAKKPGVKVTASGLQYEVLTAGKGGAKPVPTDKVKVNYEGRLIDGTVFDSSIQRGEPASFELDQVIPGWTEGLQLMSVGSKFRLTLPAAMAYGEQAAGPIPPNSVLVFEVELLDILKPDASPDAAPAK
jgi:FKBP-type peptidyl-prolyl cis-trans isomerase FklB